MGKNLKGKEIGVGIHQRKEDGRYEVRYKDRFGKRRSLYASSLVEARKKQSEALKEDAAHKSVKKRYFLKDWYAIWMDVYKTPVIKESTKKGYCGIYKKHILPALGDMYLDEIQPLHVRELLNQLKEDGYQWDTMNRVRILLQDLFNKALENDYLIKNPANGVKIPVDKPDEVRVVLTVDEQREFFQCCSGTFYDNLFVTAVNTGLRPGEICALEESDIDFDQHKVSVTKTLLYQQLDDDIKRTYHFDDPKTKSSNRDVPLNGRAEEALKKQIKLKQIITARHPVSGEFADLLFITRNNTPICDQVLNDAIRKIINEANLHLDDLEKIPDFTAHTFRHTFATRCIEAGIQPKTLQEILGHSSLKLTMDLYVHVTSDFKAEEMEKLEEVMPDIEEFVTKDERSLHVV